MMARIPVAHELGNQTRQLSNFVGLAPGQTAGLDALKQLADTGLTLAKQIGQMERAAKQRTVMADTTTELQEFVFQLESDNSDPATHFDRYSEQVKAIEKQAKKTFQDDPAGFSDWKVEFNDIVQNRGRNIRARVEQGRLDNLLIESDQSIYKLIQSVPMGDSGHFEDVQTSVKNIIEKGLAEGIYSKEEAVIRQNEADRNIAGMAVRKVMMRSPEEAKQLLENGEFAGLSGEQRLYFLERADNQILENQNRVAIAELKRSAAAQKAMDDMRKQNSTGIPPTESMLDTWSDVVDGTEFEEEFVGLLANQKMIQSVLRMPVSDQLRFVDEREAFLKMRGGDDKDIANFNTLKGAVDRNIGQMQNEPLMFYQARTGLMVEPIQLEQLLEPSGQEKLAEQLGERVVILNAMQSQYGPDIKYKPLLPQESQALTSLLKQAPPKQQGSLFQSVRKIFNDDKAYMAAMQQIAPDAPIKAMAGMLMAKEKSITMERNWFAADVSATSGDVAETLLMGESILNRAPEQKESDGLRVDYPVPTIKDFQKQFSPVVGSAFAGRPDAYQLAMQAVRAHYVGEMSKQGDLSEVINATQVKKSIKAVLGEAVDINGEGKVFAPWGMDESTFKEEAEQAFEMELTKRGMTQLADKFGRVGLKNKGEYSYYVLTGNNFLLGDDGLPIVITIQGGGNVGL